MCTFKNIYLIEKEYWLVDLKSYIPDVENKYDFLYMIYNDGHKVYEIL